MNVNIRRQRRRLEAKKSELERSIAALTATYPPLVTPGEASQQPRDYEGAASDMQDLQQERSILVNQQALLTLVSRALQRLANGTYGRCLHCDQPIPSARLEALPWAERDVRCEEQVERPDQGHFARPQTF
ncbi:MAG TPA: TraR/DksA family transcriptional regulator [Ktedonobacteraceae bacterium]